MATHNKVKIEILGRGCRLCRVAESNIRTALDELRIEATIQRITDSRIIGRRGVIETPTVVIDGQIFTSGNVPTIEEVRTRLASAQKT
ncbi:MAG TPA: thioredoxin family protein [Terriglobia bacterium]|nr:thioredoxin family protein [Terriglobia bacterium]